MHEWTNEHKKTRKKKVENREYKIERVKMEMDKVDKVKKN